MQNFSNFKSPLFNNFSRVFPKKQNSTKRVEQRGTVQHDINDEAEEIYPKKKQTDISFELNQREESVHQNIKPYETSKPRITKTVLNAVSAGVTHALQGAINQAAVNCQIDFSSPIDSRNSYYQKKNKEKDCISVTSTSPFRSYKNYPSIQMLNSGRRSGNEQNINIKEAILNTTSKCIKSQNQRGKRNLLLNLNDQKSQKLQKTEISGAPGSNLNVYIGSLNVNINLHLDSSSQDKEHKQKKPQNDVNRNANNILSDCKQSTYEKSYPASALTTNRQKIQKFNQDLQQISVKQFGQLIQSSRKKMKNKISDQNQNVSDVAEETPIMKDENIVEQFYLNDQSHLSPKFPARYQPMFSIDTVPLQQFSAQNQKNRKIPPQNKQPTPAKPSFIAAVNLTDKKPPNPSKSFIHNRFYSTNSPFQSMINNNLMKKPSIYQSEMGVSEKKPPFYNLGLSNNQSYSACGWGGSSNRKQEVVKQSFQEAIQQYSLKKNSYYHSYLVIMRQDNPKNQNQGNQLSDSQPERYKLLYQLHQKAQMFQDKDAIAIMLQILRDLPPYDKIRLEVSHLISMLPEKQLRMCYDQIEQSQHQLKKSLTQQKQEQSDNEEVSLKILEYNTQQSRRANLNHNDFVKKNLLTQQNGLVEQQRDNFQQLKVRSKQANRSRLRTLGENQLKYVKTANYGINMSNTDRSKIQQIDSRYANDFSDDKISQRKAIPLNIQQMFQFQNSMINIQRYLDEKNKIRLRIYNQKKQKQTYRSEQRKKMILNLTNHLKKQNSAFKKFNNSHLAPKPKVKQQGKNRITIGAINNNNNRTNTYGTMMNNYNQWNNQRSKSPIKPVKIQQKLRLDQASGNDTSKSGVGVGRFTVRHMSNYFGRMNEAN